MRWLFCYHLNKTLRYSRFWAPIMEATATRNFALPDLRSRVPVGMGQGNGLSVYTIGQQTGQENVTLLSSQMPSHNHVINADNAITNGATTPANNYIAAGSSGGRPTNNYSTAVAARRR